LSKHKLVLSIGGGGAIYENAFHFNNMHRITLSLAARNLRAASERHFFLMEIMECFDTGREKEATAHVDLHDDHGGASGVRWSGVWCLVSGVWCLVSGVWCLVSAVWCLVSGAWCLVSAVWCLLSGVWCLVSGESNKSRSLICPHPHCFCA
jgi:hypothetical protein